MKDQPMTHAFPATMPTGKLPWTTPRLDALGTIDDVRGGTTPPNEDDFQGEGMDS